jgi:hypothetical protein
MSPPGGTQQPRANAVACPVPAKADGALIEHSLVPWDCLVSSVCPLQTGVAFGACVVRSFSARQNQTNTRGL